MSSDTSNAIIDSLLRASWQAAVLAILVLTFLALTRRWIAPKWRAMLWVIPCVNAMANCSFSFLNVPLPRNPTWMQL